MSILSISSILSILSICLVSFCYGVEYDHLAKTLVRQERLPFHYDLGLNVIQGHSSDASVMICFHGYGADNSVGQVLRSYEEISDHLVSFNFPDYGIRVSLRNPHHTTFGSIQELLPAIHVLKKCVVDAGAEKVNLYGFSAGGGAVVNAIAVLNSSRFDNALKKIGVDQKAKR